MGRIRNARIKTECISVAIGYVCFLLSALNALSGPLQGKRPAQKAPQRLGHADFLGLLDCATRPDQRLAVRPESYGRDDYRVRYVYPVLPGHEANMLNVMGPANWVTLVIYHRDVRYAALFEVGFDGPPTKRTFFLLDGANLEM